MVGQEQEFQVVLQRDSLSTPWGFRLQGGLECQAPLTVQRVFVGGVSDGRLQRGDVVTSIESYDATHMYHQQAEDLIRAARNNMTLTVRRGQTQNALYGDFNDSAKPAFKVASHQSPPASWPPASGDRDYYDDGEDYSAKSVAERRQKFASPPLERPGVINMHPQPGMPSYVPKRPAIWKKKEAVGPGLADPGWVPGQPSSRPPVQQRQYAPLRPHSPPVNRGSAGGRAPQHMSSPPASVGPREQQRYEPPAWAGSLRPMGGPKPWEIASGEQLVGGGAPRPRTSPQTAVPHPPAVSGGNGEPVMVHQPRVQTVKYGPGGSGPVYEQHNAGGQDSDSARIAHLQYNSPIGLYSRQNAEEVLKGQTSGKPGQGTAYLSGGSQKPFDLAQSDVLRMVAEEDERRKGPAVQHQAPRTGSAPSRPQQRQQAPPQQQQQQQQHYNDGVRYGGQPHQYGLEQPYAEVGISDF